MLGDGQTSYDHDKDGDDTQIGACSVSILYMHVGGGQSDAVRKANFRKTNVATKLKLTYIKDDYLDVKIQYKACTLWFCSYR